MRSIFLLFVCFSFTFLCAQDEYEKGVVHDSILVSGTDDQTYALYLPSSYVENVLSPIVFIFEPAARGAIGIEPFLKASEKYGLILVCSNNSKNGPYDPNFIIANNLFNHIFSHFNIKENEMYVSGFSGGSRLASAIASLTGKFTGVVGCGAGFSGLQEHMPSVQNYSYVGLCGDRDMNYREMRENREYLSLIQFNSTLITYHDNHRWPPPNQIVRAFDWLHLQRLKKDYPKQKDGILSQYESDYNLLSQFKNDNELLFAAEQYERILKDYSGFIEVDSVSKQYLEFKKTNPFQEQTIALENALKVETKLMDGFRGRFSDDFEKKKNIKFKWWEKELKELESLKETDDIEIQRMVERVKYDLFARAYVKKRTLTQASNTQQVALLDRLLQLIYPKTK